MSQRTKETERAELHKTIWRIANDLRGSVDGWDFKSYVLGMLFYRFISENLTAYLNEAERSAGNPDFDYRDLPNAEAEFGREETVKEKGFYILPQDLFANVRARARHDANLNETLSRAFTNIEASAVGTESEDDIKGLFDDLDVNSAKLGPTVAKRNEKLVKLLDAIGDLNLGNGGFTENTIDAFGDAYEYLMGMYASSAGKSGGEYYTPQEVSELLARITVVGKTEVNKVYDPACGSGSLLLKFAKVLPGGVRQGFFGQEINLSTYNLCRINMFLHDVNFEHFDIAHGDTLIDPAHLDDEPFEAIVSNPPYSINWMGDTNPLLINDPRFAPAGVLAPKSKADLAFVMHMLSSLAVNGTAAIVEFPGVLYRGGAEQKIRQYLIDNNFVDAVIRLPLDLFFGTTIETCIIVLKKSKVDNKTLFIDASDEFVREGSKNKLTVANQQRILDAYAQRQDVAHYAALVDNADIAVNDYNLTVTGYVEAETNHEAVDVAALNAGLDELAATQARLRAQINEVLDNLDGDLGAAASSGQAHQLGVVAAYSARRVDAADLSAATFVGVDNLKPLRGGRVDASFMPNSARLTAYDAGDILLGNIRPYLQKIWLADRSGGCSGDVLALVIRDAYRDQVRPRFLYHLLSSADFFAYSNRHARGGKMPRGNKEAILRYEIRIPEPGVQDQVVEVLDRLSILGDQLDQALQAEAAARKQQHDYYRAHLLGLDVT